MMIKERTITALAKLKNIVDTYCDEDVDFRFENFEDIWAGVIKLSFIFHKFESIKQIKQVIDMVMPMTPVGTKYDWRLFLVAKNFTEEDFIQFLTEEKPEEWVLKSMSNSNKRVAFLCKKYKLLVG